MTEADIIALKLRQNIGFCYAASPYTVVIYRRSSLAFLLSILGLHRPVVSLTKICCSLMTKKETFMRSADWVNAKYLF